MLARLQLAAALVIAGLLFAAGASAATCPGSGGQRCAYDRIGTIGAGADGELHLPVGLALGPDNRIYVADTSSGGGRYARLNVYDSTGRYVRELVPSDPLFTGYQPIEVGVSDDGAVFALDSNGAIVWGFDAAGNHRIRLYLHLNGPSELRADHFAVARDGTLWLLYRNGLVEHRDAAGTLLGSFTVPNRYFTGVSDYFGIGVAADGHVFVSRLNDILEFAPDGTQLRTFDVGAGRAITFAPNGDLVTGVARTISRIGRDGTSVATIESEGTAPGQFSQVEGIAVAAPGALAAGRPGEETLVVADRENHRVQIVAPDGAALQIVGAPSQSNLFQPLAAWGTPDGATVVADAYNRRLARFDATGAFTGRADGGVDGFPEAGAHNVASGENVVIDGAGAQLRRFAATGSTLASWPLPGGGDGFGRAIATGPDGTIYVTNAPQPHGGLLAAYAPDGTLLRTNPDRPQAIAASADGELYVVEGGGVNSTKVDVFGSDLAPRRSLSSLDCITIESIAVDGAGLIYAGSRDRIFVFDRAGSLLARFGQSGTAVGEFDGTQLSILGDVLTITERDNNRVTRVHVDRSALRAPQPSPCGSVGLLTTNLRVKGASAQLRLNCGGALVSGCDGTAVLVRAGAKRGVPLRRKDILSTTPFQVPVRTGQVIPMRLKRSDRRTLNRKRKLSARLMVTPTRGTSLVRRVTLRAAKRR